MGLPDDARPSDAIPPVTKHKGDRAKCAPSIGMNQYNTLRRILYIGDGPKKFPLTGGSLSQANIGAFRTPLKCELEAFIAKPDLDPLVHWIASYALHITCEGTPEKSEPAWSTIYGYITGFGADLVELAAQVDFQDMDSDECLDLYQDVIDRKTSTQVKSIVARELSNFHAYLEKHFGFDVVDFSALEGPIFLPEHRIDADLVQPQEIKQGLRQIESWAWASKATEEPDAIRLNRQAHVFAILLKGTGGRHNELAALRFKDILAHPDATVVFARSSRYRRLKTSAARRVIDCTNRLSRRERTFVNKWIEVEKSRLGKSWKGTLPIFSDVCAPKTRVPSSQLRDVTLDALGDPVGGRTKVHRVRHLVASEDMAELCLAERDWRRLRRSRSAARRFVRPREPVAVLLPIHIRQKSIQLGHRRNSTTVINYFHMPWMMHSRAHASLKQYENRHTGAVVLGVKTATADKLIQRSKSGQSISVGSDKASAWLKSVTGSPTPTPGKVAVNLALGDDKARFKPISARLIDRVFRDAQKGLSLEQAAVAHGLSIDQRDRLAEVAVAITSRTGFILIPIAGRKQRPRSARRFRSTTLAEKLLCLMDEGENADLLEMMHLSSTYMTWTKKSQRDHIVWPTRDIERMVSLLKKAGVQASNVVRASSPEKGFEQLIVLRHAGKKESVNHLVAWALVVAHVTKQMQGYERRDRHAAG